MRMILVRITGEDESDPYPQWLNEDGFHPYSPSPRELCTHTKRLPQEPSRISSLLTYFPAYIVTTAAAAGESVKLIVSPVFCLVTLAIPNARNIMRVEEA